MRKSTLLLPLAILAFAAPAAATGGMLCKTAGPKPIEVSVGFGHVPGAPLVLTQLVDDGRIVKVSAPQWWLDPSELRLLLVAPDATRQEMVLRAERNGQFYDGSLWRDGRRRWVRCREN